MKALISSFLFTSCLFGNLASAAELRTAHTYALTEDEARPAATITDAAWLAGDWLGTGFGQQIEEVWTPPSAGTMVGLFKLMGEDGVSFYEIMLLDEREGSLSLKVKHFSADFIAWEEKEDFVDFRLVKIEPDALHFGGLSFYRRGPDRIDGYIVMRNGETITERPLVYWRRGTPPPSDEPD